VQAVGALEAQQPVLALRELVPESSGQPGGDTRQIRKRTQRVLLGDRTAHRDLERVLEAERCDPPQIPTRQELRPHPRQGRARVGAGRFPEQVTSPVPVYSG
jgi:hypothetical protein